PLGGGLLPADAPAWRIVRQSAPADRRCAAVRAGEIAAAEEAQARVGEVLAVEVVDDDRHARRAHERIEFPPLEERLATGLELIAVVLADHPLAGLRVVGLADAGQQ